MILISCRVSGFCRLPVHSGETDGKSRLAAPGSPVNRLQLKTAASEYSRYAATHFHMRWFDARFQIFCQTLQPPNMSDKTGWQDLTILLAHATCQSTSHSSHVQVTLYCRSGLKRSETEVLLVM